MLQSEVCSHARHTQYTDSCRQWCYRFWHYDALKTKDTQMMLVRIHYGVFSPWCLSHYFVPFLVLMVCTFNDFTYLPTDNRITYITCTNAVAYVWIYTDV